MPGYMCPYCRHRQSQPVLRAAVYSVYRQRSNGQDTLKIVLEVWDRRLVKNNDTQDLPRGRRQILCEAPVDLQDMAEVHGSLRVRLELVGGSSWQFSSRSDQEPATPFQQSHKLHSVVACDNPYCQASVVSNKVIPINFYWLLESKPPHQNTEEYLQCVIVIVHVKPGSKHEQQIDDRGSITWRSLMGNHEEDGVSPWKEIQPYCGHQTLVFEVELPKYSRDAPDATDSYLLYANSTRCPSSEENFSTPCQETSVEPCREETKVLNALSSCNTTKEEFPMKLANCNIGSSPISIQSSEASDWAEQNSTRRKAVEQTDPVDSRVVDAQWRRTSSFSTVDDSRVTQGYRSLPSIPSNDSYWYRFSGMDRDTSLIDQQGTVHIPAVRQRETDEEADRFALSDNCATQRHGVSPNSEDYRDGVCLSVTDNSSASCWSTSISVPSSDLVSYQPAPVESSLTMKTSQGVCSINAGNSANHFSTFKQSVGRAKTNNGICPLVTETNRHLHSDIAGIPKGFPRPMFSKEWQVLGHCNNSGDLLSKPDSDISLEIPSGAVDLEASIEVCSAICVDVDMVHQTLRMPEDQYIVTPMAEYWAGENFIFRQRVCIKMKHCLPPNPSMSSVRVLCVTSRSDGLAKAFRLKNRSEFSSSQALQSGKFVDEATEPAKTDHESTKKHMNDDGADEDGIAWDKSAYFELSKDGYLYIFTDHFSGYVCTYCKRKQQRPTLFAVVEGDFKQKPSGQLTANVIVHIWDERLSIRDFRQEFMESQKCVSSVTTLELLDELKDSDLWVHIKTLGEERNNWGHILDSQSQPGLPVEKKYNMKQILACKEKKCHRSRSPRPISKQWSLESKTGVCVDPWLSCVVDISHIAEGTRPTWQDTDETERITSVHLTVTGVFGTQQMPSLNIQMGLNHDSPLDSEEHIDTEGTSPRTNLLQPERKETRSISDYSLVNDHKNIKYQMENNYHESSSTVNTQRTDRETITYPPRNPPVLNNQSGLSHSPSVESLYRLDPFTRHADDERNIRTTETKD